MTLSKSRKRMLLALICVVAFMPNFALLHALGVGETIGPTGSLVARPADMMCGASMCEETSCSGKSSSCRLCSTVSCYQSAPGGGTISGWCISSTPPVCHAFNAPGTDGSMMNIVGNLGLLLGGIGLAMQALGGAGGGAPITGGVGGCAQYYPVSTPSTDPCAYYVPGSGTTSPVSNSITDTNVNTSDIINDNSSNAVNTLISSLLGSGASVGGNTSGVTNIGSGSIVPGTSTATTTSSPNLAPGTSAQAAQSVFGSRPGYAADIQIFTGNRISLLVSNRDPGANRQVSGFMGVSASPNKPPKEIFSILCRARPWSVGFLAMIAPPSYLDSLCTANGFSIAPLPPPAPPAPASSATTPPAGGPPPAPSPAASPPAPTPPPPPQASPGPTKADIWASPPSVSAGLRTSLFWNATGVLDCTLTSSEGNFSQNSLAGYASTPPITKNTTFNILCTTPAGTVSNQVIVTVQ